jgi:hypothetical protein
MLEEVWESKFRRELRDCDGMTADECTCVVLHAVAKGLYGKFAA